MSFITGAEQALFELLNGSSARVKGVDLVVSRPWLTNIKPNITYLVPNRSHEEIGMHPTRRVEVTQAWPLL